MKRIVSGLILIALILGLTACAKPYTSANNGSTVNLQVDDPFEIQLEGNPTTGYSWTIESYDSTVVKQVGEGEYKQKENAAPIGGGGIYTFKFQTVAGGDTWIKLNYHRTFEKNVPPAETYELHVVVGTMGRILEQ